MPSAPTFVAIDFETADYGRDSACALGVVRVEQGAIVARRQWLIRPSRPEFVFTYIHGITWRMVASERCFREVWLEAMSTFEGAEFLAAHNAAFDRSVMESCCANAGLLSPDLEFKCSMLLARRNLGIYPTTLDNVSRRLGIELNHHNAMSDAEACARIVLTAISGEGLRRR